VSKQPARTSTPILFFEVQQVLDEMTPYHSAVLAHIDTYSRTAGRPASSTELGNLTTTAVEALEGLHRSSADSLIISYDSRSSAAKHRSYASKWSGPKPLRFTKLGY
jgi:hypothetical protein